MAQRFTGKAHAHLYKSFRPSYSNQLFDKVRQIVAKWVDDAESSLAVDVGCGSGQATSYLSSIFGHVIGTDTSFPQLDEAKSSGVCHGHGDFFVGNDSGIPLRDGTCSYIQAFEAAHWFNLPKFYKEVDRILKPGGMLVFGIYSVAQLLPEENPDIAKSLGIEVFQRFNADFHQWYDFLKDHNYMPSNVMHQVDTLYKDWKLPYSEEIRIYDLKMRESWNMDHFLSFLKTWSGWQIYISESGDTSMLDNFEKRWKKDFGDTSLTFTWPFALLFSRKPKLNK